MADVIEELVVADAEALRDWLVDHQDDPVGVWLVLAKKGVINPTSLTYEESVLEGLCVGWIDGQGRRRDEVTHMIRFTPRRSRSIWSEVNVARIARLDREGRMQPRGLAEVEKAKADGRWEAAYGGSATIAVPDDLIATLAAEPVAQAWWDVLSSQNRYAILFSIHTATRTETKARRTEQFVAQLARGETPYPQRRRPE